MAVGNLTAGSESSGYYSFRFSASDQSSGKRVLHAPEDVSDGKPVFDPARRIVGGEISEEGSEADTADRAYLTVHTDYGRRVSAGLEVALRIVGVDERFAMKKGGIARNLNVRDLLDSWRGMTAVTVVCCYLVGTEGIH